MKEGLHKLINNAVFGHTLQNPQNHRTVDVVETLNKAKKLVAHPLYKVYQKLNEICMPSNDQLLYAGFVNLELLMLQMYDFHYNT